MGKRNFEDIAGKAEPQPLPWKNGVVARSPAPAADAGVPFMQALISAAAVTFLLVSLVLFGLAVAENWPQAAVIATGGLTVFCGTFALFWFRYSDFARRTLYNWELREGRDINGDGVIGRPVLVHPRQGQDQAQRQIEDEYRARMTAFVRGCAKDTTLRYWEPRIGRERYQEFRDVLLNLGYAAWNNPHDQRQGWRLLQEPDAILAQLFPTPR